MSGQRIRVVLPKQNSGKPSKAQGTKVYIGDIDISGVIKVTLIAEPNQLWKGVFEAYVEIEIEESDDDYCNYSIVYET